MTEFWNGIIEFIQQPIIIAGLGSFTLGGLIALIVKIVFGAKKGDILSLKAQISDLINEKDKYIDNETFNDLKANYEKLLEITQEVVNQVKNANIKEKVNAELETLKPKIEDIIVEEVVEKPKAKKRF